MIFSGQDDYEAIRDQHIRSGQGFCLVYSITDVKSYQVIGRIYQRIIHIKDDFDDWPCVLLGNKIDLGRVIIS
jgi:GTPase KRas protein